MPAQGSLFDVGLPEDPECWVYLIGVPGKSIAKIGKAQDTAKRLASLQTSHHERLSVLWKTPGGRELERMLHNYFGRKRLEGEWFDFGDEDPIEAVSRAVDRPAPAGRREIEWVPYTPYPADDDPEREDSACQPTAKGCRYLTRKEIADSGMDPDEDNPFWCFCHRHWDHY